MRTRAGDTSVAAATDIGPRPTNDDRYFTSPVGDDGAWVIAVADGVSGTANPYRAAHAATEGLPGRVESPEAMRGTFLAAERRVEVLTPPWEDVEATWRAECDTEEEWHEVRWAPLEDPLSRWKRDSELDRRYGQWTATRSATTLCVAAWTPTGGLIVGAVGDVLAFDVQWFADRPPFRRLIADPHRAAPFGVGVTSYLYSGRGYSRIDREDRSAHPDGAYCTTDFAAVAVPEPERGAVARAVVVASDGAWEQLGRLYDAAAMFNDGDEAEIYADADPKIAAAAERDRRPYEFRRLPAHWPRPPLAGDLGAAPPRPLYLTGGGRSARDAQVAPRVVAALAPDPPAAAELVEALMTTATALGLDDNATIAAAVMSDRQRQR